MRNTFDVTVQDLRDCLPDSDWGRLISYIEDRWTGGDPDRNQNVRCAEVYIQNAESPDGSVRGEARIVFRFDLPKMGAVK